MKSILVQTNLARRIEQPAPEPRPMRRDHGPDARARNLRQAIGGLFEQRGTMERGIALQNLHDDGSRESALVGADAVIAAS